MLIKLHMIVLMAYTFLKNKLSPELLINSHLYHNFASHILPNKINVSSNLDIYIYIYIYINNWNYGWSLQSNSTPKYKLYVNCWLVDYDVMTSILKFWNWLFCSVYISIKYTTKIIPDVPVSPTINPYCVPGSVRGGTGDLKLVFLQQVSHS